MAVSNEFVEYVRDQLSAWGEVSVRRMFGGAGSYRFGKMFALVVDDVVYLKVDETNRDKYLAAGSEALKPFPHKATVLSFFEVPPEVLENQEELGEWVGESLAIQMRRK